MEKTTQTQSHDRDRTIFQADRPNVHYMTMSQAQRHVDDAGWIQVYTVCADCGVPDDWPAEELSWHDHGSEPAVAAEECGACGSMYRVFRGYRGI